MTASSNANTSGLEVVAWRTIGPSGEWEAFVTKGAAEYRTKQCWGKPVEPLVTAASAQARIAELEDERDQIAGESIWWKAVIGDGEYTPSGEVPSIKHLHPATVKPIFEAHKGSAVADVIAGLIFSRAITENREQFLVGYHTDRATAAEARADRLAKALMTARDYVSDAAEGHAWTASQVAELMRGNRPDNRQAGDDLASIDAALQQETQP